MTHHHLSLISSSLEGEVATIARKIDHKVMVGGREDFERVLCELLASQTEVPASRSLDLIGHSTGDDSLLRLGSWVVDGRRLVVKAFFRELADHAVFARLGITSVRLLGCETAITSAGRITLRTLAEILGVEVLGSRLMLDASHYAEAGFCAEHALVAARDVNDCMPVYPVAGSVRRTLDIDALPASPLTARAWTVRVADVPAASSLLRLIRRGDGAQMPGLQAVPDSEVCLPSSTKPGWYAVLQIVQEGSFVRVYPEPNGPGVVFPVADPEALLSITRDLPRYRGR